MFREKLNYPYCKTTRAVSKLLDDCGVDISLTGLSVDNNPYLIQAKAGYEKSRPKPDLLFDYITEKLEMFFPPDHPIHEKPKVLIHKLNSKHTFFTTDLDTGTDLIKDSNDYQKLREELIIYYLENPDLDRPQFVKDLMDDEQD